MTSARDTVERELAKGRGERFAGSTWRLGGLALTCTDGQLTDNGRVFHQLRPSESLSHFERATERIAGSQVYAVDAAGREHIVGRMMDGSMIATPLGQGYYGRQSAVFDARLLAWRRNARGELVRTTVPLTDQRLRSAPGGKKALEALQRSIYSADPQAVRRSVVEALIQATAARRLAAKMCVSRGLSQIPSQWATEAFPPLRRIWRPQTSTNTRCT